MGNSQASHKWGTETQRIRYKHTLERVEDFQTPVLISHEELSAYGQRVLHHAYKKDAVENSSAGQELSNSIYLGSGKTESTDSMFLKQFQLKKLVGQGSYAKVFKAVRTDSAAPEENIIRRASSVYHRNEFIAAMDEGEQESSAQMDRQDLFAIKVIPRDAMELEYEKQMRLEAQFLLDIFHPNIVNLVEFFEGEYNFYIVEEYVPSTMMEMLVECHFYENVSFHMSEKSASMLMKQLLCALAYLDEKNIAHLDIKPDNLLVGQDGKLRLCDFGLASIVPCERAVHTYVYCPPEIITEKMAYSATDVWAAGVTFFLLLAGYFPFADRQWGKLQKKIVKGLPSRVLREAPLSSSAKDMVASMLTVDWKRRPSAKSLQNHTFFHLPSSKPLHDLAKRLKAQSDAKARWRKVRTCIGIGKRLRDGGKVYRGRVRAKAAKRENEAKRLASELSVLF